MFIKRVVLVIVTGTALALFGCKVEKTGEDTYKVETPDPAEVKQETKEAGQDIREGAREVGQEAREAGRDIQEGAREVAQSPAAQEIKEGAKQIGKGVGIAARDVTAAAGRGMEKAGKEMQEKAKPEDQK